ncbi:type III-B CRISPR-associated protein Cas10/Cmr2 [Candidatus Parcubacteria bacterium]|nr:MAG: type III-B CRISPR-associated protein Cas10/Cmr2 [Candidatus Parcubacteria bacterium]
MSSQQPEKEYLFLLSIGPVQCFIEAARKAQDLWAGSFLLSHLLETAMNQAAKESDVEIIFPQATGQTGGAAALPNHLLLRIPPGWEKNNLCSLGEKLKDCINASFKEIIAYGMNKIGSGVADLSYRHVHEALEIFWVAIPIDPTKNHGENFRQAEIALAGRKNLKLFTQTDAPEHSLKCSLCGERQALHEPGKTLFTQVRKFWQALPARMNWRFSGSEYLCTICLGKRLAPEYFRDKNHLQNTRFPSTAEVAASPYKLLLIREVGDSFARFETQVGATLGKDGRLLPAVAACRGNGEETVDAHWLYESNFSDKELGNQGMVVTDQFACLRNEVGKLHSAIKGKKRDAKLTPYYSVLVMDADRMGKKLSLVSTTDLHKELSKALAEFASAKARTIIEEQGYPGKLVYAGGDDLLAFVSVESLLPIMEELRSAFALQMDYKFRSLIDNGIESFTVSTGVCVSHYKNPLRVTLNKAREMVALAKDSAGADRNGFAVTVLTHSGNHKQAFANWETKRDGVQHPLLPALQEFSSLLRTAVLSPRFIYRFREECKGLIRKDGRVHQMGYGIDRLDMFGTEFRRLIDRAVDSRRLADRYGTKEQGDTKLAELNEALLTVLSSNLNVFNFISLLEIITFINREVTA